uniref:DUF1674 domain-containing protein n=1 Tax=Candidatus Kentrum sp. TUN TaxID=2126343 RepID=A0A450ZD92_9GAMM|nr:MAG: Protein of unknown function (DUF1674) [Candidatus Kentron sp. TUN]VFK51751.1 MAG: Protein of unknown function (DUF1674) [Candidatus Kentron sp. TUN]VFK56618.1 MAG: Protein of unknown function (DUF1674) [Candidatus Kentron sp. TUN]
MVTKGEQIRQTDQDQSDQKTLAKSPQEVCDKDSVPKEINGPSGPEPTRYGDWEKNGRCIDF